MQLLKIENDNAFFLAADGQYKDLDKITKDDLLHIANKVIDEDDISFDDLESNSLKNQVHNIIYKNLILKLNSLKERKKEFHDEINQSYKEEFEKYKTP